jgi:hypothetical protein
VIPELLLRIGAYGAIALAAFFAGALYERASSLDDVLDAEREANDQQVALRIASAKRVSEAVAKAEQQRRSEHEQIRWLLETSKEAEHWYSTPVPPDVADALWGVVRDGSDSGGR